jgi:hypothetical protein
VNFVETTEAFIDHIAPESGTSEWTGGFTGTSKGDVPGELSVSSSVADEDGVGELTAFSISNGHGVPTETSA